MAKKDESLFDPASSQRLTDVSASGDQWGLRVNLLGSDSSVQRGTVQHVQHNQLGLWMERYQCADEAAPGLLIAALTPALLRYYRNHGATTDQAEDLLQEAWLRIHRVRHTYRPGAPVLPWIYAIARRARIDQYRRNRRIVSHEITTERLPEPEIVSAHPQHLPEFERLASVLPDAQREAITMLKVRGLSVEEVARTTSSTASAVKQKAYRAYRTLRTVLAKWRGGSTQT